MENTEAAFEKQERILSALRNLVPQVAALNAHPPVNRKEFWRAAALAYAAGACMQANDPPEQARLTAEYADQLTDFYVEKFTHEEE
jgi:ferric-dicitrate binding protein FerR (iron transport regulator)